MYVCPVSEGKQTAQNVLQYNIIIDIYYNIDTFFWPGSYIKKWNIQKCSRFKILIQNKLCVCHREWWIGFIKIMQKQYSLVNFKKKTQYIENCELF